MTTFQGKEAPSVDRRIAAAFSDLGKRSTRPRRIIARNLARLARDGKSFTAEELVQAVRNDGDRVGRATVFRSIERLVDLQVLDRIDYTDGSHGFFVCSGGDHHHHLACTRCHRVVRFDYCLPSGVLDEIAREQDFSISDHALTLFGTCRFCGRGSAPRGDEG